MTAPRSPDLPPKAAAKPRDDRLKAALKANMARRKAQARARAATDDNTTGDTAGNSGKGQDDG